jgi:hypothetical protein
MAFLKFYFGKKYRRKIEYFTPWAKTAFWPKTLFYSRISILTSFLVEK